MTTYVIDRIEKKLSPLSGQPITQVVAHAKGSLSGDTTLFVVKEGTSVTDTFNRGMTIFNFDAISGESSIPNLELAECEKWSVSLE